MIIEEKASILQQLESGVRANRLAIDSGISQSAVSQIKKQKDQIHAAVSNSFQEAKKKNITKRSTKILK